MSVHSALFQRHSNFAQWRLKPTHPKTGIGISPNLESSFVFSHSKSHLSIFAKHALCLKKHRTLEGLET